MTATRVDPPPRRRRWIKWVLIATLLLVVLPGGCVVGLMSTLAGSEPASIALAYSEKHPAVAARLGTPLRIGRLATGNIAVSRDAGSAEIAVPIYGPKGSGTAEVTATKAAGRWTVLRLVVQPDDGSAPITVIGAGLPT